jgi:hypothetical protein
MIDNIRPLATQIQALHQQAYISHVPQVENVTADILKLEEESDGLIMEILNSK